MFANHKMKQECFNDWTEKDDNFNYMANKLCFVEE